MSQGTAVAGTFLSEVEAYALLREAGLHPPAHGLLGDPLPFSHHQPVVLKGLGEELWHKSELDCVRFLPYAPEALAAALLSNAGFESVTGGDLLGGGFPMAKLTPALEAKLGSMLAEEGLGGLVSPHLPLDLTPMAEAKAYLKAAELLLQSEARILVVGLVPFTRRLPSELGQAFAHLAKHSGKAVALAVDAGADHGPYREALTRGGLPVFTRMEKALMGLRALE